MSGRAIVIGAGPNGLTAAIALADGGRDVLVCEAASEPGGAVRTQELTLPGFRHDTFSSVYPAGAASPVFARLGLERHGLRWVHPEVCSAHVLGDDRAAALHRDLSETAASLDALAPGDGDRWARFARPYLRRFGAVRHTMLKGFPPIIGATQLAAGLGPRQALEFARLMLMPANRLSDELFDSPGSSAWLASAAMHGDTPPTDAGSAIAGAYLNLLGHAVGWPSPEGGAGRLTAALVERLRAAGGELRCDAPVARVLVRRGRVAGVELDDGERLDAPLVIADVVPRGLLALAGDELPARYVAAMRRYRMGHATLKVDWALDGPVPWSSPVARRAGTVHVGGELDEVVDAATPGSTLPERPFLLFGQQTVADPTRAPDGKHTAWAYTHAAADAPWAQETDRHVERVEAQIERFAPGFRDRILASHVLGPKDLEARNRNLVDGDVGGGSYVLYQTVFRPAPSLMPYRTPLRGLYIGSAATFPGGAVHGVPGNAAARAALAEARVRRF